MASDIANPVSGAEAIVQWPNAMRRSPLLLTVLFVTIAAATSGAQRLVQRTPPRDTQQPLQTGTSVIRGRVMAANSGRPLRRAQVSISAPGIGRLRTTSTDADGRYEFTDLPAGRFTMMV